MLLGWDEGRDVLDVHYIYIYAFSRRFYPKLFTVNSGYTFICQYVCSLGIEPTTFALLTQCSTTEPQELDRLASHNTLD